MAYQTFPGVPRGVVDELEIYKRIATNGTVYFAAKVGFMLYGIIMPVNIVDKKFVEQLERLHQQCRVALESGATTP